MKKMSNWLWGIFFIVVGVVFGINALGIADINIFFDGWWTLFIIVPCFIGLFNDEDKKGSIIGLLIGVLLLLGCLDVIDFNLIWKLMVPMILVIIGLSFIFKDTFNSKVKKEIKKLNKVGNKEYCATFSEQDLNFSNEEFTGCSLTAVFGSVKCDLRGAIIKEDALINTSSIFGGINVLVPDDVNVKVNSTGIFGGVSDERKKKTNDGKITIYIDATAVFGGIEIK